MFYLFEFGVSFVTMPYVYHLVVYKRFSGIKTILSSSYSYTH